MVAHRGASELLAEHTLAAYRRAVEDGADGLECDVRLTRDGHLVCVHDRTLGRTSTGRGVVSTKRLEELDRLDWGSWKNPWADLDDEAEEPDPDGTRLLTLEALLTMVAGLPRRVPIAIETKHPTRYSGLVEHYLAELLHQFGLDRLDGGAPPVRVMSFSRLSLRRMQRLVPEVPRVLLVDERIPVGMRGGELPRGIGIVGPSIALLRKEQDWVRRVRARGGQVHCWTVNRPEDVDLCVALGVAAVITDRPGQTRSRVDGSE